MKTILLTKLITNGTYDELNFIEKILIKIFSNYSYKIYSMGFKEGYKWKEE